MRNVQRGYLIQDLELTKPIAPLEVPRGYTGVALVLRRTGCPVGFCMEAVQPGTILSREAITTMVQKCAGVVTTDSMDRTQRGQVSPLPSLTFAVCTRNRHYVLGRCVEQLLNLDRHGFTIEVLVVDNAPTDDRNRLIASRFPNVRYVCEPRPGLSFARNRAMSEANGELVAYIDDDAVVDHYWLRGLAHAIVENPDAVGFSGPILPLELATRAQILLEGRGGFGHKFERVRYGATMPGSRLYPCGEAGFGGGANMIVNRQVLLAVGGFDEALGSGTPAASGEDLDIFYRLVRGGHVWVHEPRMIIFHQHRRDMASLRRQVEGWGVGNVAYMFKAYRCDPELRPRVRRFLFRLLRRKTGGVVASALGLRRYRWPAELALAELRGVFIGALGSYSRSVRQIRIVKASH